MLFSDVDLAARAWVIARCEEEGLVVRQDAVGNIFARWHGDEDDAPAVATGSHIDAIPNAGRYDGVVGVLGALEAFSALRRAGFTPCAIRSSSCCSPRKSRRVSASAVSAAA